MQLGDGIVLCSCTAIQHGGLYNGMDGKCQEKPKCSRHEVFVEAHSLLVNEEFYPFPCLSLFSKRGFSFSNVFFLTSPCWVPEELSTTSQLCTCPYCPHPQLGGMSGAGAAQHCHHTVQPLPNCEQRLLCLKAAQGLQLLPGKRWNTSMRNGCPSRTGSAAGCCVTASPVRPMGRHWGSPHQGQLSASHQAAHEVLPEHTCNAKGLSLPAL